VNAKGETAAMSKNERIIKLAWNQMDSQSRCELLRNIYPEYQMVNHMASSKWHQIPQAARNLISTLANGDLRRPRRVQTRRAAPGVKS
jgi:hypothetical protein